MHSLIACLTLFAACPLFAEEKTVWQKVTLKGTKAQVQFPGKPTEKTEEGRVFLNLAPKVGFSYSATMDASNNKIDINDKEEVKKRIDAGRDGLVKLFKSKLLSEKEIKLGKYPGRAIDIQKADGIYRTRVYLTNDRIYQVVVIGPKEFVESADAKKFLDSLTIDESVVWQKATLTGTNSHVLFPGKPTASTASGVDLLVWEAQGGNAGYMASVMKLPKKLDITDKDAMKRGLDSVRDAGVKSSEGKLLSDKAFKLGKYPGRAYDYKSSSGRIYRGHIVLTGDRLFQIAVLGPKEFVDGADAKKFLASFKIGE